MEIATQTCLLEDTGRNVATQTPIEGVNLCDAIYTQSYYKTLYEKPRKLTKSRTKTTNCNNKNSVITQTLKTVKSVRKRGTNTEEDIFFRLEMHRVCEEIIKEEEVLEKEEAINYKEVNILQFSYRGNLPVRYKVRQLENTEKEEAGTSIGRLPSEDPLNLMKEEEENRPEKRRRTVKRK